MTLLYHRSISGIKTSVTTKNGVVALTGIASNQAEIDLARKLASDVKGVQKVDNRLIIEK
jgi:osmotically-inducible protein OsmY